MPGPKTPAIALRCARQAFKNKNVVPTRHATERMVERGIHRDDVNAAIELATHVEPYRTLPKYGGTCWRVLGPDRRRERTLAIGIEVYSVPDRSIWIALCTVIDIDD